MEIDEWRALKPGDLIEITEVIPYFFHIGKVLEVSSTIGSVVNVVDREAKSNRIFSLSCYQAYGLLKSGGAATAPTAPSKQTCRCPIKELLTFGHAAGCPEKRA